MHLRRKKLPKLSLGIQKSRQTDDSMLQYEDKSFLVLGQASKKNYSSVNPHSFVSGEIELAKPFSIDIQAQDRQNAKTNSKFATIDTQLIPNSQTKNTSMQDLQKMQTEPFQNNVDILGADAVVQANFGSSLGFSEDKADMEENDDLMGQQNQQLQEDIQIGNKVFQRHNRDTSRHLRSSEASNGAAKEKTPLFNVLHNLFETENRIYKEEA